MILIYSEHLYKLNHYIFFVVFLTFRYKIYDLTSGNSTLFFLNVVINLIHERKFQVTYPWIYLFFSRINHVIIIKYS